jgi:hemerythrin superfamily protein
MFSLKKLSPSITDMIRFDHSHVMVTFHQYTRDKRPSVKKALAETICDALEIHATLEEEIFYPVMRPRAADQKVMEKSEPEHMEMRRVIDELRRTDPRDSRHDDLVFELMRDVVHHVADEETVLLPEAEQSHDQGSPVRTRHRDDQAPPAAGNTEGRQDRQEHRRRLLRQHRRRGHGRGRRAVRGARLHPQAGLTRLFSQRPTPFALPRHAAPRPVPPPAALPWGGRRLFTPTTLRMQRDAAADHFFQRLLR